MKVAKTPCCFCLCKVQYFSMDKFLLLTEEVRASYVRCGMPGHVLLACSGGADSTALLLALHALQKRHFPALRVDCMYCDHGYRKEAKDEAAFVRDLCASIHVPFHLAVLSPLSQSEDDARAARYDALYSTCSRIGADCIALAHHLHDQTETVLLHLFRGTASGLKGMSEWKCNPIPLWRPLLHVSPTLLRDALTERSVSHMEDKSNGENRYLRNFLRLEALPALRDRISCLDGHVSNAGRVLSDESAFMDTLCADFLARSAVTCAPCPFMDAAAFEAQHVALRRRCFKMFAEKFLPLGKMTYSHIDEGAHIRKGQVVNLPDGLSLYHTGSRIHLVLSFCAAPQLPSVKVLPYRDHASDGKTTQAFPKSLYSQTTLRFRKSGDFIRPFGMDGTKSLQDYFTDRKVDKPFRDHVPLVCIGNEVLWAVGVGASEKLRTASNPDEYILLNCELPFNMTTNLDTAKEF